MSEAQRDGATRKQSSGWKAYLQEEVTAAWGDAVLIVGCFATGLLDSAVFNVWSCFVSMQTGKSIPVTSHHLCLVVSTGDLILQATLYMSVSASLVNLHLSLFATSRAAHQFSPLSLDPICFRKPCVTEIPCDGLRSSFRYSPRPS